MSPLDISPDSLHYPRLMYQDASSARFNGQMLMVAGVAMQYVATRLSITTFGTSDGRAPGRLALAQWLPILATTVAVLFLQRSLGGVAIALSLVLGMTAYVTPVHKLPAERRVWNLILPAAILLLLAGFKGTLHWYHALMLLIMGAAFLWVWLEPTHVDAATTTPLPAEHGPIPWNVLALSLILAGVGAWLTVLKAPLTGSRILTPELLGASVLSPLLLLPSMGAGAVLAQNDHTDRFISSLCGIVLLNLCLLLPLVIFVQQGLTRATGVPHPVAFPMITWRVDTVLLVVLSFALVPVATGRWMPGKFEAVLLVIGYAAYVIVETAMTIKLLG